jgi:type I restriction enzyme, S subunit
LAINQTEREIALLREYRTTLTAEVVTGKLDVREAAKRLPDQADEPLPADESLDDLVDDEEVEA